MASEITFIADTNFWVNINRIFEAVERKFEFKHKQKFHRELDYYVSQLKENEENFIFMLTIINISTLHCINSCFSISFKIKPKIGSHDLLTHTKFFQ